MWLTPPIMKIQITDFAFASPVCQPVSAPCTSWAEAAWAAPSRNIMALSASPVKPMPVSSRNCRRVRPQPWGRWGKEGVMAKKPTPRGRASLRAGAAHAHQRRHAGRRTTDARHGAPEHRICHQRDPFTPVPGHFSVAPFHVPHRVIPTLPGRQKGCHMKRSGVWCPKLHPLFTPPFFRS